MPFTRSQVQQLLRPINPKRVLKDGKGHSHVSQQDVVAHLIRIFGFGNFDVEITGPDLIFEAERVKPQTGESTGRWDCCYRAKARLVIKDPDGNPVCYFDGSATATAQNQTRGDAHDLAMKSAESVAKKRAATNLGDQFGLSLYNKGQLEALVRGTFVLPEGDEPADAADVQDGVPQQVAMGHDEIDRDLDGTADPDQGSQEDPFARQQPPQPNGHRPAARPSPAQGVDEDVNWSWLGHFEERVKGENDPAALQAMKRELIEKLKAREIQTTHSTEMTRLVNARIADLEKAA